MKQKISNLLMVLMLSFAFAGIGQQLVAQPVAAVDVLSQNCSGAGASSAFCKDQAANKNSNQNPIIGIIKTAIIIVSYMAGAAAVIGILFNSIRFMTAGGDSGKIASAKSGLILCVVGIAVVILSQSIVVFVLNKL